MTSAYADIRQRLLNKITSAEQKSARVANIVTDADREVTELLTILLDDDIVNLVREINQEIEQNREAMIQLERKNHEFGRQLTAIQANCKHSNEEVDSEGSIEIRTCKFCGRSRTLNYSTSHLHGHGSL